MNSLKPDLILHPVRLKIIQSLAGDKRLTATELLELNADIPQATMYRHLKILLDNGIVRVAEQNRIRGTVQIVYTLSEQAILTPEDLQKASREEHMQYFVKFVAMLLDDFGNYLEADDIDLLRDGVGYRQNVVYLSDEEFIEFTESLAAVYREVLHNKPSKDRVGRFISTIIMPREGKDRE